MGQGMQTEKRVTKQMNVSFKCPECGQHVEDSLIEMVFELSDTRVTVSNVPATVCPNCGQEFVDGYVAENVNGLVDDCSNMAYYQLRTQSF